MVLSDVFDPKVIYDEGECDWACNMFPESGCVFGRGVAMDGESFG
jgi:hypothetical protein